ncbi:MAG TPA: DUF2283 domain-containing protein [Solirubrobacteraceae bacterium]|nr:DUF2283 domain-containing protein [Solirubrobacteraceae bacterium]
MTVKIGPLTFDHASYDESGDVLYLHAGQRQAAADSEQTPEGHVLRFDAAGKIIGLTIINAKWLLARDGELIVTLPEQVHVAAAAIEAAFATAA